MNFPDFCLMTMGIWIAATPIVEVVAGWDLAATYALAWLSGVAGMCVQLWAWRYMARMVGANQ